MAIIPPYMYMYVWTWRELYVLNGCCELMPVYLKLLPSKLFSLEQAEIDENTKYRASESWNCCFEF